MAQVVLFHHALGLTSGVLSFAQRLESGGNTVLAPDLFEGRRFDDLEGGVAYASEVGFGEIIARGASACANLDGPIVHVGMSLGVLPAQYLAQTSESAVGAVLLHSCVPVTEFSDVWPPGVAVQIHAMEEDPWFVGDGDIDAANALVEGASDAHLFLYPGTCHLFTDESTPDYDAEATELAVERITRFLGGR